MSGCTKSFSPSATGLFALTFFVLTVATPAADLTAAQKAFRAGAYEQTIQLCEQSDGDSREDWAELQAQALLTVGRYAAAEAVVSNALERISGSVRLRWLGIETAHFANAPTLANQRLREINELVTARSWAYRTPPDLVALGRFALRAGADPKTVLERLFNPAREIDPNNRDIWLASGELALDKHDFALAARTFTEALKKLPDDPDLLCGLARAYQPNARPRMGELARAALAQNENHVPSLLLLAEHLIDAEEYAEAEKLLDRALRVNPWHPEAWAGRAVLAHLRNDAAAEAAARATALRFWATNPRVDHLIGAKLSQNYRFAEGAAAQRRALACAPDFLPARIQLAEDLLRLGEETEGWQLAAQVQQADGYDVTAYNLVTLHQTMQKFQTLTNEHFVLRMGPDEAALYGDRALALLERARSNLTRKYGVTLAVPTYIEIFPEQKDFGVRTFGLPHNPGFLGVCFGRVVTANSPAAQAGHPASWEAVLWHEFTHVVTLQLTKNKMPRWLSEGISVYEELQANPTWGQMMNPRYREMILGPELTPVGELSSAFLSPKSDLHVQFAYYQSALVVEFLVGKFGFGKLRAILADLAGGTNINAAIARHTAPLPQIETEFRTFATTRAEALGPTLDWEKPEAHQFQVQIPGTATPAAPANLVASRNYWVLLERARAAIAAGNWTNALPPLQKLVEGYPDQSGPNNAYALLAEVYRQLKQPDAERAALENWAARDSDAWDAYLRLIELAEATADWPAVARNAERALAVNPLIAAPHRSLARAAEELGDAPRAIVSYRNWLRLDPLDPAEVHFRLARLLRQENRAAAKRHVLQALEEAPRYRAAQQLLLELARADASPTTPVSLPTP